MGSGRSLPLRGAWIEKNPLPPPKWWWETSLPLRGAWIEKRAGQPGRVGRPGRSPYGERGLKKKCPGVQLQMLGSLPLRGAWIENAGAAPHLTGGQRRSPYGERGLKTLDHGALWHRPARRSPYGERGLKRYVTYGCTNGRFVAPLTGSVD